MFKGCGLLLQGEKNTHTKQKKNNNLKFIRQIASRNLEKLKQHYTRTKNAEKIRKI